MCIAIGHDGGMQPSAYVRASVAARIRWAAFQRRLTLLRSHFALQSDRQIYFALAALEQRRRIPADDAGPLTRYEMRCFSQNGEDGVLAEILARIGAEERFFVEFGIQDGREGNCVLLADVDGWRGLFIEASGTDFARLERKYQAVPMVRTVNAFVSPQNIESLLSAADVPADLDVLSIDIDGQEYWIWDAVRAHRPRVVVVEYNSALPAHERLVAPRDNPDPWDGTEYMGSSLAAFEDLAAQKGYVLVHTDLTALNAFFVRADLADGRFPVGDDIPRRQLPNYNLAGVNYLPDPLRRPYLDLGRAPN